MMKKNWQLFLKYEILKPWIWHGWCVNAMTSSWNVVKTTWLHLSHLTHPHSYHIHRHYSIHRSLYRMCTFPSYTPALNPYTPSTTRYTLNRMLWKLNTKKTLGIDNDGLFRVQWKDIRLMRKRMEQITALEQFVYFYIWICHYMVNEITCNDIMVNRTCA